MIGIISLIGLVLRVVALNQSFWLDEATTANTIKNLSVSGILTDFSPHDFHPPLYYLIAKLWSIPFGVSEIALRFLSIIFALVTIYVVYLIGKQLATKTAGNLAAILVATAPLLIYYSQEARMYALDTLLVTLAVWWFIKEKWPWFALTLALLGATDYLPLLIIPAFLIFGSIARKKAVWWTKHLISYLPLAIFFAWWAPYFGSQLTSGTTANPRWVAVLGVANLKNLALVPVKFVLGRISFDSKFIYAAVVGSAFLVFGYVVAKTLSRTRKTKKMIMLVWLWLLVPICVAFVLAFKFSVFSYFRLIFVVPALYLLVALGLLKVKEQYFLPVLVLVVFFNSFFSLRYLLTDKFHREDWRGAVAYIEANSDTAVALFPANSQMEAYTYYSTGKVPATGPAGFDPAGEKVWLVRYVQDIFDPGDTTRKNLENAGYTKIAEHSFNGIVVWEYTSASLTTE